MTEPLMIPVGDDDDRLVPHWAALPEDQWPLYEEFAEFLKAVWSHLRLPAPTRAQIEIARRLQYGPEDRAGSGRPLEDIIRAFRGVGKSYVTAAFVLWRLMRNPRDEKVLVVSATGGKSKEFVGMVKSLLNTMDILAFLRPRDDQRNMADKFDVNGSSISQSFSLKAAGITGQITGSRATLIVADDIEIEGNSKTEEARERLMRSISEFEAIKLPGADVVFLGTPQTEESIYNRLVKERQYTCFCIPARYPALDKIKSYTIQTDDGQEIDILAPYLVRLFEARELSHGSPTDPQRFGEAELLGSEAKGRSFFALQYQLDTSLSDAERYPLRQQDLIVFETNPLKAPLMVQWGLHTDRKNVISDIPNLGFTGDHLRRPLFVDDEWRDYEGSVLFVDPAGRGKDETAWAILKVLSGFFYLVKIGYEVGDPTTAMQKIALDAKLHRVNVVEVEPNFGQGMWVAAFQPILAKVWPGGCTVQESEWAKGQKETRIIDTLEPVLTQHRLVVSESFLREDAKIEDRNYSFLFQLTHITRERGCLKHDDRLDAVAGAVAHFVRAMSMDTHSAAKAIKDQELSDYLDDLFDGLATGGVVKNRGRRKPGGRTEVWSTEYGIFE